MAPPPAAQFSPGQILEAGRRAENDGRVGYAIQFYRHLTDHHGWSPEAAVAKEALARLSNVRPAADATTGQPPVQPSPPAQPSPPTYPSQTWSAPPQGNPQGQVPVNGPRPATPYPNGNPPANPPANPPPNPVRPITGRLAVPGEIAAQALRLPEAERRYRIGSAVAWLLFGIGLTLMAAGLAFLALHAVGLKVPGTLGLMLGFTGGMPGAMAIFTVGVTQVFAAQIGRAMFDTANATRDLAMIERAKIAHAAGERPFSEDDEPV